MLEIIGLKTHYPTTQGTVKAVDGIDLAIRPGEVFGLAGESGCGKSTLIRTLMRLLPKNAQVTAGRLSFKGSDLLSMRDRAFREQILWKEVSLVPQSAMSSFNPVYRVGDQIVEAIRTHTDLNVKAARKRVALLFDAVGLQADLMERYPHEFSGGMRQRAIIAMSLVLDPSLIVMDEPTTGLDVLVQERILRNLAEIRQKMKTPAAILLITHDISVIAEMSDRIAIMYAGRLMEEADALSLFREPYHPYTMGLKNAFPSIRTLDRELISIPGTPPALIGDFRGCIFSPRCPFSIPDCNRSRPPFDEVRPGHRAACIRTDHAAEFRQLAEKKQTWHCSKSKT